MAHFEKSRQNLDQKVIFIQCHLLSIAYLAAPTKAEGLPTLIII